MFITVIREKSYLIVGSEDELHDDDEADEGRLTVVEAEGAVEWSVLVE